MNEFTWGYLVGTVLVIIPIWILCGFISYGLGFALWQRKFPTIADRSYKSDRKFELVISLFGPFGLVATLLFLFVNGFYGFKLK